MNKIFLRVLLACMCFLCVGCAKKQQMKSELVTGTDYDMVMYMKDENLTPNGGILCIENHIGDEGPHVMGGPDNDYHIEYLRGDEWYYVNYLSEEGWSINNILISYAGEHKEIELDWSSYYGSLPKGKYRIVKQLTTRNPMNNQKDGLILGPFYLCAEFQID